MSINQRTVDWRKVWREAAEKVNNTSWEHILTSADKRAIKAAVDAQVEAIVDDLTDVWASRALRR